MATRSKSPKKAADEKFFPIRVRIQVPEEGFGPKMGLMFAWMNEHAGRGRWGWNADMVLSTAHRDASSLYLMDAELIAPFLSTFGLQLAEADADLCGEGSFRLTGSVELITPA
ncbi:hypothetical protein [uncultured Ruegeria sp.]|uniref:hypothetical protein n=1 Tax=uncultured Ruegeria sp. TaxID=259304 RepID=UPI002604CEA0|nr:hypothetical protein [uncultured Ruegeria sp.]